MLRYLLIILGSIHLLVSCETTSPQRNISLADITEITIGDCEGGKYKIVDNNLMEQLWLSVSTGAKDDLNDLKLNTGFYRTWIHLNNGDVVYIHIVSSIIHGHVIVGGSRRRLCANCDAFFEELKEVYPSFKEC